MRPFTVVLLALIGCSTTRTVARPLSPQDAASINDEVHGKIAAVELRNESCCRSGEEVVVSPETIEWTEDSPKRPRFRVPPEAVERLTVRNHGRGAAVGAGIGLVAGLTLGSVLAAQYSGDETYFMRSFITGITLVPVVLLSTLVGAAVGTGYTFQLTSPPP
jgi:hypothetical protein